MSSLVSCFEKLVKEDQLVKSSNGQFCLKGAEDPDKYTTTLLVQKSDDVVVFSVGQDSHSSFVTEGYYGQNCDYIFIKIKEDKINFILCELKSSENKIKKGYQQLKCSIPLAHYLKKLLDTHFENYSQTEIKYKKVLLIKKKDNPDTIKNIPKKEDDVFIFEGDEFALKEFLDAE